MTEYTRVPAVERTLTGGRLLVLPRGAQTPTELDGSAPDVWTALAEASRIPELVEILQNHYEDDEFVIVQGLTDALDQLTEAGLVEVE